MTATAVGAEVTPVDIVAAMTGNAARIERHAFRGWPFVTVGAAERPVCAVDPERRAQIVVEFPPPPVHGVVAITTVRTEVSAMRIVGEMAIHACLRGVLEALRLVATRTFGTCVGADQRETRQVMIEPDGLRPGDFAVAGIAGIAELSRVRVLVTMAAQALGLRARLTDRNCVTVVAAQSAMRADQPERRIGVVVETHLEPTAAVVTAPAILAVDPGVLVVVSMAGITVGRQFDLEYRRGMAGTAGAIRMPPGEGKPRLARVIEARIRPDPGIVTCAAVGAVQTVVRVVGAVTRVAIRRRICVNVVFVAGSTLRLPVPSRQRETGCHPVIETRCLPVDRIVTVTAGPAEPFGVRIIFGMTGITARRGFPVFRSDGMAVGAIRVQMRP